jgi:hypothetical protein
MIFVCFAAVGQCLRICRNMTEGVVVFRCECLNPLQSACQVV